MNGSNVTTTKINCLGEKNRFDVMSIVSMFWKMQWLVQTVSGPLARLSLLWVILWVAYCPLELNKCYEINSGLLSLRYNQACRMKLLFKLSASNKKTQHLVLQVSRTNFAMVLPGFPRLSSEPCTEPCYSMYFLLQSYSSLCLN